MSERGCLTCKFADYLKTPTGKLKKGEVIHCRAKPPSIVALAAALTHILPVSMWHCIDEIRFNAHGMRPDEDHSSDCPIWEPKEATSE